MKKFLEICVLSLCITLVYAQQKNYTVYSLSFYNLENLFDTEDDPDNPGDDEFLPASAYHWTQEKYEKKLDNLARVISRIGREYCPWGPAVIGVAEVENRKVLEDLVKRPAIAMMGLEIVHRDSPDRRGIDVALLYNPKMFTVTGYSVSPYRNENDTGYVSRDQLWVSGILAGEKIHVSVNHWPSRYGAGSSVLREAAAANVKAVVDSLYQDNPDAKILIMGDLNDDPVDKSTRVVLNAKKSVKEVKPGGLYNPMWRLYSQGIGSLAYQGKWSLFDQIIVSYPLLGNDYSQLRFWKAEVFNKDFLIQSEGPNKGYPHRTFSNNTFINGYSDHLPVIVYLIREE
ncbi:endonuclease/exonuclease/phosphatase family protein [Proteiniphilum sp. X52]|uniref:endonuclease/exonuclease/phosphatase family protein n=1 Tax=Proteiniphilum sp. X52 TaxID=2382159 RepID=UPI000F0A01AD|nr:endonuclease/exonuclease/phosphatase family protein [Proteiniphilum sp. X52]RNC65403.1 endonuclease/exonuclease/phosphatase family protein [Proteiniphilum sp. X52]